jgi:predicted O-linked N-acetylglucosamine transferase (SPINDLY family)
LKRQEIENLLEDHRYQEALQHLATRNPSSWRDTSELRCLRALVLGDDALRLADQLYKKELSTDDIRLEDPQQNAQLRYIALVFSEQDKAKKACEIFRALCERTPLSHILRREYASALILSGDVDQAEEQYQLSLEIQPNNVEAQLGLASLYRKSARVDKALDCYYRAATLEPNNLRHLQRIANWSNYSSLTNRQSSYHLAKLWNDRIRTGNIISADQLKVETTGKITIGFLITSDYPLPIESFVIPLLNTLDRSKFKVATFIDKQSNPQVKQLVAKASDSCHDSSKVSDSKLAKQISSHGVDVLVDLTGIERNNRIRVFSKQPAPLQISWLGYPATTGLASIKYRISDRVCDPQFSSEHAYTEELLRLQSGVFTYAPPSNAPAIETKTQDAPLVFGAFGDLTKVSDQTIDLWAAVLRLVPESILKISHQNLSNQNTKFHLIRCFHDRSISDTRLVFECETVSEDHLDAYQSIDIALDTAPYNDVAQTLFALWMGVPVISLQGETYASRLSSNVLSRLGLEEYIAKDALSFASIARRLGEDKTLRNELSTQMRSRIETSSLTNNVQFSREFGEAIQIIWEKLCSENTWESSLELGLDPSLQDEANL